MGSSRDGSNPIKDTSQTQAFGMASVCSVIVAEWAWVRLKRRGAAFVSSRTFPIRSHMHHDKSETTGQPPLASVRIGPILFLRETTADQVHLGALFVVPSGKKPPVVQVSGETITNTCIYRQHQMEVLRYDFGLPLEQGGQYVVDGDSFQVVGIPASDLQLAFVSCNGQEHGDYERPIQERNAMWRRLADQHATTPLSLLLHGGDQLYADEMLRTHPLLESWVAGGAEGLSSDANVAEVEESLRDYLFRCYSYLYQQPEPAHLLARVPSLCM